MDHYWLALVAILGLQLALIAGLALLAFKLRKALHHNVRIFEKSSEAAAREIATKIDRTNEQTSSGLAQIEGLITLNRLIDGKYAFDVPGNWALRPDLLIRLVGCIQKSNPETIVECGSGASTIIMASALREFEQSGHLISFEHDRGYFESISRELRRRNLDQYATVVHAPLREKTYDGFDHVFRWYALEEAQLPEGIDMLVIDGPPGRVNRLARYPAGPELFSRLAPGARVFLDDANREDESQLSHLWEKLFSNLAVQQLPTERGAVELRCR